VLLRSENNGASTIDSNDDAVLDDDKAGIRQRFPPQGGSGSLQV
jgi:hypothetical protein